MNLRVFTVGFAIFTMFFGAGNITLPLILAQKWPSNWVLSYVGFSITAVLITLLGLISAVHAGSTQNFFKPLGVKIGFLVQLVLILIEGPFGVVPRCLIVAFGGIKTVFPDVINWSFYLLCSIVIFYYAVSKKRLVSSIGNYITPILLTMLLGIFLFIFFKDGTVVSNHLSYREEIFYDGLLTGYLTYDLPGAIYFTGISIVYLKSLNTDQSKNFKLGMYASLVSAVILLLVYLAFFYIGVKNIDLIKNVPPEKILPTIIVESFGKIFAIIFSSFIFIACITTAIAAITIWTDFLFLYIPSNKTAYMVALIVSLGIASFVAMFDFTGLIHLLSPVLNFVYPILIGLSIFNIYTKQKRRLSDG
ncbi:MAG: branched-chain amino acid transport system II carrier protein [Rickettsiales bacterium]